MVGRPPSNRRHAADPLQRAIAATAADTGIARIGDVTRRARVTSSVALAARYKVAEMRGQEPPTSAPPLPAPAVIDDQKPPPRPLPAPVEAAQTDQANLVRSVPTPPAVPSPVGVERRAEPKPTTEPDNRQALQKAQRLLKRALKNGPVAESQIESAFDEKGLKAWMLPAADRLGVKTRRGQWWLPG